MRKNLNQNYYSLRNDYAYSSRIDRKVGTVLLIIECNEIISELPLNVLAFAIKARREFKFRYGWRENSLFSLGVFRSYARGKRTPEGWEYMDKRKAGN